VLPGCNTSKPQDHPKKRVKKMPAILCSMLRILSIHGTFLLLVTACATQPKAVKKPYEFCYCGAMKGLDNKNYCGIWADRKRLDVPHNALGAFEQKSCTPEDCSQKFSSSCERMQMWAYPAVNYPEPSASPCFCDASLVENDRGQITLVCAAWQKDSEKLLEYYVTKECKPETCGSAPFQIAGRLCPKGFQGHYLPFPKTSVPAVPVR
jgi:hypothetical protein